MNNLNEESKLVDLSNKKLKIKHSIIYTEAQLKLLQGDPTKETREQTRERINTFLLSMLQN